MAFLSNSKLLKLVTTREIKKYAQCLYCMERGKIQLKCMARLQNKLGGHFSLIIVLLSELPVIRPSIFMGRSNQWLQKCMLSRRACSYTYGFYLPKFCNAIWEWFLWTMSCVWYTYSLVKKSISIHQGCTVYLCPTFKFFNSFCWVELLGGRASSFLTELN